MTEPVVARLRELIAETEAKIIALGRLPALDEYPHNTIIRAVVRHRRIDIPSEQTFVFLKRIDRVHAVVGPEQVPRHTWTYTSHTDAPWHIRFSGGWLSYGDIVAWAIDTVEILHWDEMVPDMGDAEGR